eukprot:6477383-Pyramimonas_sp.AAC.1
MAADYNPYAITVGGSLGHGLATLGAVGGGRWMATKISEKTITFMGGCTFLVFAVLAFFEGGEAKSRPVPEAQAGPGTQGQQVALRAQRGLGALCCARCSARCYAIDALLGAMSGAALGALLGTMLCKVLLGWAGLG